MSSNSYFDKALLNNISRSDKKAFEVLFKAFFPKIKTFLAGFLNTIEEAEDLAQDVFVKLWKNRSSMVYVENLNAYLYRIAKNTLFDYIEKSDKIQLSFRASHLPEISCTESLEELLLANELNDLINLAIERMPSQRKKIFNLSRKKGLSNEEIAHHLSISKRTVETHISAALSDIRKILPLFSMFF